MYLDIALDNVIEFIVSTNGYANYVKTAWEYTLVSTTYPEEMVLKIVKHWFEIHFDYQNPPIGEVWC